MGKKRLSSIDGDYDAIYQAFIIEEMKLEVSDTVRLIASVGGKWHGNERMDTDIGCERYDWFLKRYGQFTPRNT